MMGQSSLRNAADTIGGLLALVAFIVLGVSTLAFLYALWEGGPISDIVHANFGGVLLLCLSFLVLEIENEDEDEHEPIWERASAGALIMGLYLVVGLGVLVVTFPFHNTGSVFSDFAVLTFGSAVAFAILALTLWATYTGLVVLGSLISWLFGTLTTTGLFLWQLLARVTGALVSAGRWVTGATSGSAGTGSSFDPGESSPKSGGAAPPSPSNSEGGESSPSSDSPGSGTAQRAPSPSRGSGGTATSYDPNKLTVGGDPTIAHEAAANAVTELGLTHVKPVSGGEYQLKFQGRYPAGQQRVGIFTPAPGPEKEAFDNEYRQALLTWQQVSSHPNVSELLEYDTDGWPWGVMALPSDGDSLPELRESLSLPDRLDVLCDIADCLRAVHRYNDQNLSLRPSAVTLDTFEERPTAMVHDWGVQSAVVLATDQDDITRFTAPEQLDGERFDPPGTHTDIYRLGAVASWVLSGTAPQFDSDGSLSDRILAGQVRPATECEPTLPENVDEILKQALATDPAERYDSVYSFRQELTALRKAV